MQTATNGIYKEIKDAIEGKTKFKTVSGLLKDIFHLIPKDDTNLAIIECTSTKKVYSDSFSQTGRCDFYRGKKTFNPAIFSVAIQKSSLLKSPFNARLIALKESGLYSRWAHDQMANGTFCLKMPNRLIVHTAYTLQDLYVSQSYINSLPYFNYKSIFQIVFLLLVLGYSFATVVFVLELIINKQTLI